MLGISNCAMFAGPDLFEKKLNDDSLVRGYQSRNEELTEETRLCRMSSPNDVIKKGSYISLRTLQNNLYLYGLLVPLIFAGDSTLYAAGAFAILGGVGIDVSANNMQDCGS